MKFMQKPSINSCIDFLEIHNLNISDELKFSKHKEKLLFVSKIRLNKRLFKIIPSTVKSFV